MVGTADSVLTGEVSLNQSALYREVPLYLQALSLRCLTPLEVNKCVEVVRVRPKRNNLHIALQSKLCHIRTCMYVCM